MTVVARFGQRKHETGIRDDMGRIAAVARISGELRAITQVFLTPATIWADTTGVAEPRNAHAHSNHQVVDRVSDRIDPSNNFVAGDQRQPGLWKFAVNDMQIGSADAARCDAHPHFPSTRRRVGERNKREWGARRTKLHGPHERLLASNAAYSRSQAHEIPSRSIAVAAGVRPAHSASSSGTRPVSYRRMHYGRSS